MGLGIIISGVFILRVKPNARFVAAWIAFTAVIYAIGKHIIFEYHMKHFSMVFRNGYINVYWLLHQ